MKVTFIFVILNSSAILLNADEEAKSEEAGSPKANDADAEKMASEDVRDDGTTHTDDIIKAFLRDSSSDDEVYKTATLNIKSKKNSGKERNIKDEKKTASKTSNEKEKTGLNKINSKVTSKSAEDNITFTEKYKSGTENKTLEETDKMRTENKTLEDKDKTPTENKTPSVEENISSTETLKNVENIRSSIEEDKSPIKKEENKRASSITSDKESSEAAAQVVKENDTSEITLTQKERSAIDDMDDLIIPYELNKFSEHYDVDDDDKTLYAKTQNSHEEVEPTLTDSALHNYHHNRRMFDSIPHLDNEGISEYNEDLENLQSFNTPTPFKDAEIPLGRNAFPPFIQRQRPPLSYLNNYQSLPHVQQYQPITFSNRQETINSPNRLGHLQEMTHIPNGWSYSQETEKHPKRLEYLEETPYTFHKSQNMQSNSAKYTHPQETTNDLNRWSQSRQFPNLINRWRQSEDLKNSFDYENHDVVGIPSDSNAYPYVPPQTNKMPESNMNPIFMKLAQASNVPQQPQNLPRFLFRHPGVYRHFDPRLNIQRNFPFIPRFRRFSLENYHDMSRVGC